jgi:acetyl-CoA acetyltransferase
VSRADQDAFALRSQQRAAAAIAAGSLDEEIVPSPMPRRRATRRVQAGRASRAPPRSMRSRKLKGVVQPTAR